MGYAHAKLLQSCLTCNPMYPSPPGSSAHGILQARILEWVAVSSSKGSSQPRDWTGVSCISCTGRWALYGESFSICSLVIGLFHPALCPLRLFRSDHIVANGRIFLCLRLDITPLCIYTTFLLWVMLRWTLVPIPFQCPDFTSCGYILTIEIQRSYSSSVFNFCGNSSFL